MRRKIFTVLTGTLTAAMILGMTSFAAVDDSQLSGTTIEFWHSMGGVNGEALTYLIDKFNNENEYGITVNAEYQGEYDDAINKLKSAQIGNMGADLVQIYDLGTRFMIDSGWVVPMQDLIDAAGFDTSDLEPNVLAYYTVDNKLYSMPFNSSTPILYYNKDMFEKAGIEEVPTSLEGILNISDQLMSQGGAGEAISIGIYGWFVEQWLCKQGLNFADKGNGREAAATAVEFDSNGGMLNILNEWNKLYEAGAAPNVGSDGGVDFTAGKAAMTLGSTASLKQYLEDVNGSFEIGTAYYPSVTDGGRLSRNAVGLPLDRVKIAFSKQGLHHVHRLGMGLVGKDGNFDACCFELFQKLRNPLVGNDFVHTGLAEIFPVFPVHLLILAALRVPGRPKATAAKLLRPVSCKIFKTFCGLFRKVHLS